MTDSRPETYQHIAHVRSFLHTAVHNLLDRAHKHDATKLRTPEVEAFDAVAGTLKTMGYNTPEYKEALKGLGPALQHHYAFNDHHPEHFLGGVHSMNLLQVTEMLCDWLAAVKRMENGDIYASIEVNQERFGYDDGFKQLLINTVPALGGPAWTTE